MARRLEGRTFCECHNNGVTALAMEEAVAELDRLFEIGAAISTLGQIGHDERTAVNRALDRLRLPIFTFAREERVRDEPWFTGDFRLYQVLCDYVRDAGGSKWPGHFYVPFSNGIEMGHRGLQAMCDELQFVTTRQQFRDVFGISYDELVERVLEAEQGRGAP